jgi:hypothetical protein
MENTMNHITTAIMVAAGITFGASSVHATEDFCAVVLKTPDGFLALRDGPGPRFKMKVRLHQGDFLDANSRSCTIGNNSQICDTKRQWTYITSVRRIDGPEVKAKHFTGGWVSTKFIKGFACPEDQAAAYHNKYHYSTLGTT